MIEEFKSFFLGRTGAWIGLVLYVVMDMCIVSSAWLESAPDKLSEVSTKGWIALVLLLLAGAIKTARSYVSGAWGDAKDGSLSRRIYGQQQAPPITPTAQKGET